VSAPRKTDLDLHRGDENEAFEALSRLGVMCNAFLTMEGCFERVCILIGGELEIISILELFWLKSQFFSR
jgi:hypothetical protein